MNRKWMKRKKERKKEKWIENEWKSEIKERKKKKVKRKEERRKKNKRQKSLLFWLVDTRLRFKERKMAVELIRQKQKDIRICLSSYFPPSWKLIEFKDSNPLLYRVKKKKRIK